MKLKVVVAAVLAWLAMPAPWALADEPRDLVVGVEELDYFPVYAIQNGAYVGAAREILDAFAQSKGYAVTYRPLPIKRLMAELLSGGIDLKFPDNPYWAADLKAGAALVYSKPVVRYVDGVMVVPQQVGKGTDAIRTLGTVSGFTPFAWLDRIKAGRVVVKETPRMDLLVKQVTMARLDGAYASVAVVNHHLAAMGMPGALVFDPGLPHSSDAYMLSSRTKPQVVAEFDAWLAANQAQVKAIKARAGAETGLDGIGADR